MRGRDPLRYADLPEATEVDVRSAIGILSSSAPAAYFAEPNLLPLIGMWCTRLSTRHGMAPQSPYGIAVWALVLCGALGRIELGYRFGQLALEVGRRFPGLEQGRGQFVFDVFVAHWKEPLREVTPRLLRDWGFSLENGDEETATYCAGVGLYNAFLSGESLDTARERAAEPIRQVAACAQEHSKYGFLAWATLYDVLRGEELPDRLRGPLFDIDDRLPWFIETRNGVQIALSSIAAGIFQYLAGRHERAHQHLERANDHVESVIAQVVVPGLAYYRALAALGLARETTGGRRRSLIRIARKEARRLARWSAHAPVNLEHRVDLVEAELERQSGRTGVALLVLHRAIELAAEYGALGDEAIACERLSELHAELENRDHARFYRARAGELFARWGARAKAAALASDEPVNLGLEIRSRSHPTSHASHESESTSLQELDVASLMKAVRTISGEIDLDRLLDRTMEIVLENAGADRGLLILDRSGTWMVEIEGESGTEGGMGRPSVPLGEYPDVARSIAEFALRTGEVVLVDDAPRSELYGRDPHVVRTHPRAVLCGPIVLQGRPIGLVYLENHVTGGAFTSDRLRLVEALAAQAAISIENARLYDRVQRALETQTELTRAQSRFVPREFLSGLGRDSIADVAPGDASHGDLGVLFADIRGFTALSERMTPEEAIRLINRYLHHLRPAIARHHGFVDHFSGDGIMALFPGSPDDGVRAGVAMIDALGDFNRERTEAGEPPLRIGIGFAAGPMTLGTIGDLERLQCSVIGDTVNLASRLEGLTKQFGVNLIVHAATRERLDDPRAYGLRPLGPVRVVGRDEPVKLFEVVDAADPDRRTRLRALLPVFGEGLGLYLDRRFAEARVRFESCLEELPDDLPSRRFVERSLRYEREGVDDRWDGVEQIEWK